MAGQSSLARLATAMAAKKEVQEVGNTAGYQGQPPLEAFALRVEERPFLGRLALFSFPVALLRLFLYVCSHDLLQPRGGRHSVEAAATPLQPWHRQLW